MTIIEAFENIGVDLSRQRGRWCATMTIGLPGAMTIRAADTQDPRDAVNELMAMLEGAEAALVAVGRQQAAEIVNEQCAEVLGVFNNCDWDR
ncbi:MAG: hypothetical protein ACO3O3_12065 [Ilumatobacteraceae bacterium]